MAYDPRSDGIWQAARDASPHREPYCDEALAALRIDAMPGVQPMPANLAVIIWTLLDMLEEQKGWTE